MNREHVKNGVSLLCAAVPLVAMAVAHVMPEVPVGEAVTKQMGAILQSVAVLLGFRFVRATSLPAGLAHGYFWSFVEPLANGIPTHGALAIDGRGYRADQVRVEIWLPPVIEADGDHAVGLAELRAQVDELPEATLETEQHGLRTVRVRGSEADASLVIVDVPRTLDVLEKTLSREFSVGSARRRRKIADRELAEFETCLRRSIHEQRGAFFRKKVAVQRFDA